MQQQSTESKSGLASTLWRLPKILLFIAPILCLGSLNILTLLNDQAHATGVSVLKSVLAPVLAEATLSHLLSRSPTAKYSALEKSHKVLESKHIELNKAASARSQVVKNISIKVAHRAIANALKNIASYAAEIIPFAGVAAITALTISDLYDDCQTLKDLKELDHAFGHETADANTICKIKFP